MVTASSVVNALLYSTILVVLIWASTLNISSIKLTGPSNMLFISLLLFVRMFLPVEFRFSIAYLSNDVLPAIDTFVRKEPFLLHNLSILNLFMLVWILGTFIRLALLYYGYMEFANRSAFYQPDTSLQTEAALSKLSRERPLPQRLRIIRTNITATPSIFGFLNTTINIPNRRYTDIELYYSLKHELQHYYNRDLWCKLALEILTSLYWWFIIVSVVFRKIFEELLEFNADVAVVSSLSEEEQLEYLNCILNESKKVRKRIKPSLKLAANIDGGKALTRRFQLVLGLQSTRTSKCAKVLGVFIASLLLFSSFVFVAQPHYPQPHDIPSTAFTLDAAYVVKQSDLYIVYSGGYEVARLDRLNETLKKLPLYQSESEAQK